MAACKICERSQFKIKVYFSFRIPMRHTQRWFTGGTYQFVSTSHSVPVAAYGEYRKISHGNSVIRNNTMLKNM